MKAQHEPQLSAEIDKQVDAEFFTYPKRVPKEELIGENSEWHLVTKGQLKHFLATALEEQRADFVRQVEELETTFPISQSNSLDIGKNHGRQEFKRKVLALLTQKKGDV